MHWSKEFFTPFLSQGEGLSDATTLFEYLDEIFYLIRSCGIRSLSTLNKSIACGFLNHLQSTTLLEDLYSVTTGLLDRFLKKEFFNSSMMCFTSSFNLYNMIVIILLNNTDRVLVYSRNLKDVLVEEQMNMAGHYIEPKDSEMVHSCLEEFEIEVHKKFTQLLENRMAFLTDNLKSTVTHILATLSPHTPIDIDTRRDREDQGYQLSVQRESDGRVRGQDTILRRVSSYLMHGSVASMIG